ncbi:hypothetical protein HYV81_05450 [Candidatus Woesearchaeota archaeon]|nr:hypothetical protein [Candidatus Woesearchaeota archaeon]
MNIPRKQHRGYNPIGDCGKGRCPVCARNNAMYRIKAKLDKEQFMSDGISPFVGRFGYPNINVGIMTPPEQHDDAWLFDAPKYWSAENYAIPKIVDFRSSLLNSRSVLNIRQHTKLLELSQDIAMSSKPVDVEIHLKEKPKFRLQLDSHMAPTGAQAQLKQATLAENPKIHTKVYKVFDDIDLKAQDAVTYLYENKFDENFLTRVLSVGVLGAKANRKLVPTRFSITATDDIIGKHLIETIKDYQTYGYAAYFGGYLGNYFLVLFFPEVWSYELFEMYAPSTSYAYVPKYTTDYEDYYCRKSYVEETAGGYYASRLPALEKLNELKRQSSCLVLRFITDEYSMPLGVWVVREAARKSLSSRQIEFSDKELMLNYAKSLARKKFGLNIEPILRKSSLLQNIKQQSKLSQFV